MRRVALEPRCRVIQPPLEFVPINLVFSPMVRGPLLILRLEDAVSIVALDLLVLGFVDALRLMLGVRHGFIPWGIWVELPQVTSSSVEILRFLVALVVPPL